MKYCAFLRGVNVNGTTMKMAEVCQVFQQAGMDDVSSILASGNIVFSSDKTADKLKPLLEKAMSAYFDYDAFLFICTQPKTAQFCRDYPFGQHENLHRYVFIGAAGIEQTLMNAFEQAIKIEDEQAQVINGVFYWQIPKGQTLASAFGKVLGKKSLKDQLTNRNINTIEKILKKMT